MLVNKIEINGRVYQVKQIQTKLGVITTFSLAIYMGKDKQTNKNKYKYINCKSYNEIDVKDEQDIIAQGKLIVETYINKENKEVNNTIILVENVLDNAFEKKEEVEDKENINEIIDDDLPF